jgi:hypothetical protein
MHDILATLDLFVWAVLERPKSYASSPESLDDSLYAIEALRNFLRAECFNSVEQRPALHIYLTKRGFLGRTLCEIFDDQPPGPDKDLAHKYAFVVDTWRLD